MASILRKLKDDDLLAVHHMIRQDGHSDLDIARSAERMLKKSLGKTDHAKEMVISRYRGSKVYATWLRQFQDERIRLERDLRTQKERLKMINEIMKGSDQNSFEGASMAVQARLLSLANAASDEELKDAAGAKGWITQALKVSRDFMQDKWRKQVEELKSTIEKLASGKKGKVKSIDMRKVVDAVDEIMGLK